MKRQIAHNWKITAGSTKDIKAGKGPSLKQYLHSIEDFEAGHFLRLIKENRIEGQDSQDYKEFKVDAVDDGLFITLAQAAAEEAIWMNMCSPSPVPRPEISFEISDETIDPDGEILPCWGGSLQVIQTDA